jgi:uncharacterized protein YceK
MNSRACLIALTLVGSAALSGCSSMVSDTAVRATTPTSMATPPAATQMAVAGLPGLLLPAADIGAILGSPSIAIKNTYTEIYKFDPAQTSSNPDCDGDVYSAMTGSYRGSGYTAINTQRLEEPGVVRIHTVDQSAATFPTGDKALAFVTAAGADWSRCAGTSLSLKSPTTDEVWTIAKPDIADRSVSTLNDQGGGARWACSHSLVAKSNVVADVMACGQGVTDQGAQLANKIADRVPA